MCIYRKCLRLRGVTPANPYVFQAADINQAQGKHGHFGLSCPMFVLHYLHGAESVFRKSASQVFPYNL